jgi:putative endonuclease
MYYIYILRSKKDKKNYTGYTNNLKKRVSEHNNGQVKSTKNRRPFELVYFEGCINIKDAKRRETYLKTTYGKRYIKNRIREYLIQVENIS